VPLTRWIAVDGCGRRWNRKPSVPGRVDGCEHSPASTTARTPRTWTQLADQKVGGSSPSGHAGEFPAQAGVSSRDGRVDRLMFGSHSRQPSCTRRRTGRRDAPDSRRGIRDWPGIRPLGVPALPLSGPGRCAHLGKRRLAGGEKGIVICSVSLPLRTSTRWDSLFSDSTNCHRKGR
jgi:hypothetical protein